MAEWTKATVLKTVVLRTPVNESLSPKKEAPRLRGFSCFKDTPIGKAPGVGYLEGRGVVSGGGGKNLEPYLMRKFNQPRSCQ